MLGTGKSYETTGPDRETTGQELFLTDSATGQELFLSDFTTGQELFLMNLLRDMTFFPFFSSKIINSVKILPKIIYPVEMFCQN